MVQELRYLSYMDYFWRYPGMELDDGLLTLKDEDDVMNMLMFCLPKNTSIELYIVQKTKQKILNDEMAFLGKMKEVISPKKWQ